MPGGGAAIKVSRTDQFAPEISKGRPSRRPFHIKPNPQRRFAGQSRQSAGQNDILFCNVRYWPARPTWKISKHAEIRENTSDTSSYALLLFGRKRRRQTRKDVVALPVAIHPVRRIWLWGFRYVLFEFGRRYLVICTADVRPKRYGNVANRHPRTPQLFRASRSRRRSQLPGHKDRSSARLAATPQAAPCPVEHREPLERHRQGKSRYWISCARLRRSVSSCDGGCQTSFRSGNRPWIGCSASAWPMGSSTCKNGRKYKSYVECTEASYFLAWKPMELVVLLQSGLQQVKHPTARQATLPFCNIMYRPAGPTRKISKRTHAEIREIHRPLPVMLRFLLGESDVDGPGQGHGGLASRGQIGSAKNAVRAAPLQRRGMAAMARRRGLFVSVHADARRSPGGRKHRLGMFFRRKADYARGRRKRV